jgi:hypothetical protein
MRKIGNFTRHPNGTKLALELTPDRFRDLSDRVCFLLSVQVYFHKLFPIVIASEAKQSLAVIASAAKQSLAVIASAAKQSLAVIASAAKQSQKPVIGLLRRASRSSQ